MCQRPPRRRDQRGLREAVFENADPIGRTVGIGNEAHSGDFEIVGIAEDEAHKSDEPVRPMLFLSAFQSGRMTTTSQNVQLRSMSLRSMIVRRATTAATSNRPQRAAAAEVNATSTSSASCRCRCSERTLRFSVCSRLTSPMRCWR